MELQCESESSRIYRLKRLDYAICAARCDLEIASDFVHSLVMETIYQEAFGLEKLEKNAISFDYDMMM